MRNALKGRPLEELLLSGDGILAIRGVDDKRAEIALAEGDSVRHYLVEVDESNTIRDVREVEEW